MDINSIKTPTNILLQPSLLNVREPFCNECKVSKSYLPLFIFIFIGFFLLLTVFR